MFIIQAISIMPKRVNAQETFYQLAFQSAIENIQNGQFPYKKIFNIISYIKLT